MKRHLGLWLVLAVLLGCALCLPGCALLTQSDQRAAEAQSLQPGAEPVTQAAAAPAVVPPSPAWVRNLGTVVVVVFLFGITIFVHELGHFLVARGCGMVVEVFSIGFGPALWKREKDGVTYKIGLIPFGGYVALPQMEPGGKPKEGEESKPPLPRVAPWKKILVSLAGVTGNALLAVLLAYIVYWVGKPSAPHERTCSIGFVETNSPAYAEGLREGDRIVAVNGVTVGNWDEFTAASALSPMAKLDVDTAAGRREIELAMEKNWMGIWMVPGISWVNLCGVAGVVPGSSAEAAGIRAKDVIVEFDGRPLHSREHLIYLVNQARDREVPAKVERDGGLVEVRVRPTYDEASGRALIGVMFNTMDIDYDQIVHPAPWSQIRQHATGIVRFLKALTSRREARAASQAVGGPVAILIVFWWTVQRSLILGIWFTCFFNVNLAIFNLLPIPILDGGHVVFALWEILTRRPLSERFYNRIINFFAILLIALFLFLTYRDIFRWIVPLFGRGARAAAVEAVTNEPPAEPAPAP